MSQQEILCPNCRGGNSPQAIHCQWCGVQLREAQNAAGPVYSAPAPARQQQAKNSGCTPILGALLLGGILLLGALWATGAMNPRPTTSSNPVATRQTVAQNQPTSTRKTTFQNQPTPTGETFTARPTKTRIQPTAAPVEPTATALPAPPTEPPTPAFEILDPVTFKQQYSNYLTVIGIIRYKGTVPRMSPEIIVTLTDAEGKVLATEQAYTSPDYIRPGSTIPYKVLLDGAPETWAKTEIDINAEEFGGFWADIMYTDLEIEQPTLNPPMNEYSGPSVVGRVKNTGASNAQFVEIVGALYDAEGRLLDVASTYSKKDIINAGGDGPFELDFRSDVVGATFELFVEGRKE